MFQDLRDDKIVRREDEGWFRTFALEGGNGGRFWTLFHAVLAAVDPEPSRSRTERMRHAAWTNLSKLNAPSQSAPPDNDEALRALDVEQMRREIAALDPDILLCVSGSMVPSTGHALFDALAPIDHVPSVDRTWTRRLPNGGVLYWTMHPQGIRSDPQGWMDEVVGDVLRLATLPRAR